MNKTANLRYIKHGEIDFEKWNRCIDNAPNCRVYAYDWHLDRTAVEWDALVWRDYEFVMPLPFRKKFGISYLYQPLFTQQMGIFPTPQKNIVKRFYTELFKRFHYSDLQINAENPEFSDLDNLEFVPRKNYLLPLPSNYKTLASAFSTNTKRNLAKANKNKLHLVSGIRLEEYMDFKIKNLPVKLNKHEINSIRSLIALGQHKGFGEIYGVYTADNNLCAAVYFCRWKNRIIYMNAASNKQGKELRGMYFLVDQFLKTNAGKNMQIDFEGSMIPGVARFYEGFGAAPETYFQLKFNRLPLPLKWFKS